MLDYNEILPKKYIDIDDEPYQVLSAHVFRKQQRKPVNQTKLRNLITGKVLERSFHQNETIPEADIETKQVVYIFSKGDEAVFHMADDKSARFSLPRESIEDSLRYTKEGTEVTALLFNEEVVSIEAPIKVELEVVETQPNVKGGTAQGGSKPAVLETGATVTVPMFINVGDRIRLNTQTGDYTERVKK